MTREGLIFPIPFLILAAISFFLYHKFIILTMMYISCGFFFLALLVMLFFRDPERKIPGGDRFIISPADGRIIRLDNTTDHPSLSIFLSIFNVHVNRAPVSGVIKSATFHPGKFYSAFTNRAQRDNQRNEIEIETGSGIVRMHQVAGAIARRTIFRPEPDQAIRAGERIGIIRFGSRVDLFLPPGSSIDVKMKQKVVGGETVLGRLP